MPVVTGLGMDGTLRILAWMILLVQIYSLGMHSNDNVNALII